MTLPRTGRYDIKHKLGEGGMGVVFRAYDPPPMDRDVALKTLPAFADPLALELFYKECRVLKSISHPNVVEIFDMGECDDEGVKKPFFVMPLLPGQTLEELIRTASHRLTVPRVVEIICQTCRGLQAAHDHGLIHRDLKPSNIFVMPDDSVKIIDFGVAHAIDANSRTSEYAKGTLLYMAPEQVQHKPISPHSDIFSLGVVCYEALTRRQPFRGTTEAEIAGAILTCIPAPAGDLNPSVNQTISRVVHKAMAKHAWNRFDSMREFADTLQKALRNEPIELFDPARIQPRLRRAGKALEAGDYQFAGEIVGELEAEGTIDAQLTLLRTQIDQVARQKTIAQLLEGARARYEDEEDPLALQKIQEVLRLDPSHAAALGLKSKIDERRSERQIAQWVRLARQHLNNHSYNPARDAVQNVLSLRPNDTGATELLKEIETEEHEYLRLRRAKAELYQSALNAWKNGEVSHALSQMKIVLDLDRRAPDTSSPETGASYQAFYNKVQSEHAAINSAYADARRQLAEHDFARALGICEDYLAKYPGHALFQALKFDVQEQERQQLSAFIADVDRRLEAEPDLDAKVSLLREAIARYPDEVHFQRPLQLIEDKRDLVNSIVARARVHEERAEIAEALSDLEILETIYRPYPGLKFEQERLQKRLEQQARQTAKAERVARIKRQVQTGDYARALEVLDDADVEFPDDPELRELRNMVAQTRDRASQAEHLYAQGQELCASGEFDRAIETFTEALQLDDRPSIRVALRDLLVQRAQTALEHDWREAERLVERALELDLSHPLARSIRARVLDAKREAIVDECAAQARRLQTAGELAGAIAELEKGAAAYPAERRLTSLLETLRQDVDGRRRERVDGQRAITPTNAPDVTPASAPAVQPLTLVVKRPEPCPEPSASNRRALVIGARSRLYVVAACAALLVLVFGVLLSREPRQVEAQKDPTTIELPPQTDPEPPAPSPSRLLRIVALDLEGRNVWIDDRHVGQVQKGSFVFETHESGKHVLRIGATSGAPEAEIAFTFESQDLPRITDIAARNRHAVVVNVDEGIARVEGSFGDLPVRIDGHPRGTVNKGALEIPGLSEGAHELTIGAGTAAQKLSFTVAATPRTEVILFTRRDEGSILLVTDQDDAVVLLDGRVYPAVTKDRQLRIPGLSTTQHTISVEKNGFLRSEVRTVRVTKDKEVTVEFSLAPVEHLAGLVLEGVTRGARVSIDDVEIGVVDAEGRLTRSGIVPGAHTVVVTLEGHEPKRVVRQFTAGATIALSGADLVLQPRPATLEILADAATTLVISRADETIATVTGTSKVVLPPGSYVVTGQGSAKIAMRATVALGPGDRRTADFRHVPIGLELFDTPPAWMKDGMWFTRRGGGFALYDRPRPVGRFSFIVRRVRSRIPFLGGWRARWVVSYVDPRNYVLLQVDDKHASRTEVVDGKSRQVHRSLHNISEDAEFVYVTLDLAADQLVQQVSANGQDWEVVDSWTGATVRGPVEGRFGFYLPGDDEIRISNFTFSPAPR